MLEVVAYIIRTLMGGGHHRLNIFRGKYIPLPGLVVVAIQLSIFAWGFPAVGAAAGRLAAA